MKRILGDWSLINLLSDRTAAGLASPCSSRIRSSLVLGRLNKAPLLAESCSVANSTETILFFSFSNSFKDSSSSSFFRIAWVELKDRGEGWFRGGLKSH